MADLEERRISDLTRALEVDSSALFEMSAPDYGAESGYSSYATDVETMAQKMLGGINFETQLQTNAKNIFGAINEANQHGGGGGGSDVTMSDNPNGGVDLDVEGTVRTLAKQETIDGVVAIEENEEVDEIDVVEPSDIANMATKSDIANMATKSDIANMARLLFNSAQSRTTITIKSLDTSSGICLLVTDKSLGVVQTWAGNITYRNLADNGVFKTTFTVVDGRTVKIDFSQSAYTNVIPLGGNWSAT